MKIQSEKKQIEINCKFTGRFGVDGSLVFGPYVKHNLKKFIKDNPEDFPRIIGSKNITDVSEYEKEKIIINNPMVSIRKHWNNKYH